MKRARNERVSRFASAVFLVAVAGSAACGQSEFIPLGSPFAGPGSNPSGCLLSGFATGLYGVRISGDGSTVAGMAFLNVQSTGAIPIQAYRWTRQTGSEVIAPLFDTIYPGIVGITFDGSTIYGSQWRWNEATGFESLTPLLPPGPLEFGYIFGASSDGSVVTGVQGSFLSFGEFDAFRWPINTGPRQLLPRVPEYPAGAFLFNSISGDGSVVAGSVVRREVDENGIPLETSYEAAVWLPGETITLAPFASESFVNDLSFDGQTAVGSLKTGSFNALPFRWTPGTGTQILPGAPGLLGPGGSAEGRAVSADGSVIVGQRIVFGQADAKAIYFDDVRGLRDLDELLTTEFGLGDKIAGWRLLALWDVSDDGRSLVGTGFNPDGCVESFLVVLDPCPADITNDNQLDFADFLAFFNCFDTLQACAEVDGEPGVNFGDFLAFFNGLEAGCTFN